MSKNIKSEREFKNEDIAFDEMFIAFPDSVVSFFLKPLPCVIEEIFGNLFRDEIVRHQIDSIDFCLLYDIETGHICDYLGINVVYTNSKKYESFQYMLSDTEKELFESRMRKYVHNGKTLADMCAEYYAQ